MKIIIVLSIFLSVANLGFGQENQYISISQIEKALTEDWEYLHNILESKRWVFFDRKEYTSWLAGRIDYDYSYKKGEKELYINIENTFEITVIRKFSKKQFLKTY